MTEAQGCSAKTRIDKAIEGSTSEYARRKCLRSPVHPPTIKSTAPVPGEGEKRNSGFNHCYHQTSSRPLQRPIVQTGAARWVDGDLCYRTVEDAMELTAQMLADHIAQLQATERPDGDQR